MISSHEIKGYNTAFTTRRLFLLINVHKLLKHYGSIMHYKVLNTSILLNAFPVIILMNNSLDFCILIFKKLIN